MYIAKKFGLGKLQNMQINMKVITSYSPVKSTHHLAQVKHKAKAYRWKSKHEEAN